MNNRLVWIDLEMTGVNPEKDVILEIATVVTDDNLAVVAEGPNVAIHQPEEALSAMDQWPKTHHKASGLVDRVKASPYDCKKAEQATLESLYVHCRAGDSPLCGNSVWQDRRFLEKYMPSLNGFLHYRNVDVSSIKELVKRWYPTLPLFKKQDSHLALNDIRESIAELEYYRQKIFLPIGRADGVAKMFRE